MTTSPPSVPGNQPEPGGWTPPAGGDVQWAPPSGTAPLPDGQWDQLGTGGSGAGGSGGAARKPSGRGKLLAAAVVSVAVAGGAVATYAAVSDTNQHGAASPREAVQTIIDDLNKSDLIGVLEDLTPGERAALVNPALDGVKQLKQLKVLNGNADPSAVAGFDFEAKDLKFAPNTIEINDHVQVVELVGGSVTVGGDLRKIPFTAQFLKAAFPAGLPTSKAPETVDVAKAVADNGGPLRLAAQKVDGRWYPSIGYTVADNAAHEAGVKVSAADYLAPAGASSPEQAVRRTIEALITGDVATAIKLVSPEELPALHDFGGVIAKEGGYGGLPVRITDMQFRSRAISGGAQRVTATKVSIREETSGSEITVATDGSCTSMTQDGDTTKLCADDLVDQASSFLQMFGVADSVTAAQRTALGHLITGVTDLGLDVTEVDGAWYVNPVRSYLDVANAVLGALQGDDAIELTAFFAGLGE